MDRLLAALILALPDLGGGAACAAQQLPIFDAHVHYNETDWAQVDPERVVKLWDAAGVARALVSSTPDDGTLKLDEAAPGRVVRFLRPYRTDADRGDWFASPEVFAYVERRLGRGGYRGIGEFHLYGAEIDSPHVRRWVALAVERKLVLQVHCSARIVETLQAMDPKARILWAHAGVDEPPQTIGATLARHPGLMTELSIRAHDIAPGGKLDPQWRALFLRFPDRFMIGSDTARASRWEAYLRLIGDHRRWLGELPGEVAAQIAHGNAERYFADR